MMEGSGCGGGEGCGDGESFNTEDEDPQLCIFQQFEGAVSGRVRFSLRVGQ